MFWCGFSSLEDMRVPDSWRRSIHGLGVDFGVAGVKAVALAAEGDGAALVGAGRELLPPGAVSDGAVRDPKAAAAALRRLLSTVGARCRVLGMAIGGSSVFIKRLPAPTGNTGDPQVFRDAVAREAARHLPFHIESVSFDYQRSPDPTSADSDRADRIPAVVFGAAPRELVRAHCDAASGADHHPAQLELEPYALFAGARLEAGLGDPGEAPDAGSSAGRPPGWAFIEIGAQRSGVHVFREGPTPAPAGDFSSPPGALLGDWRPADLLASVVLSGLGADAVSGAGRSGPRKAPIEPASGGGRPTPGKFGGTGAGRPPETASAAKLTGEPISPDRTRAASDRLAAALREALEEAGMSPPVVIRLSGGGALLPGISRSLSGLAQDRPSPLDPLRGFGGETSGPEFAVAAGLALQQLSSRSASPGRHR